MITLNESISVKNVKGFLDELITEIKNNDEVIVDFSKVSRVDLSVVQVIISAGREAKEKGKTIKLKSVSPDVKYQMQLCGLKT